MESSSCLSLSLLVMSTTLLIFRDNLENPQCLSGHFMTCYQLLSVKHQELFSAVWLILQVFN